MTDRYMLRQLIEPDSAAHDVYGDTYAKMREEIAAQLADGSRCSYCKQLIPPGATFCPYCKAPVTHG